MGGCARSLAGPVANAVPFVTSRGSAASPPSRDSWYPRPRMKRIYSLRIGGADRESIAKALNCRSIGSGPGWMLSLEEGADAPPIDFVGRFLALLEGNYEALAAIGVQRHHIAVWLLYEYDEQCNLEFSPEDLRRLGENGIALCVSCWQGAQAEGQT